MAVKSQLKPAKQTEAPNEDDRNKVAVYARGVVAAAAVTVLECLCWCRSHLFSFHFISIRFLFSFPRLNRDAFYIRCRFCEISMKFNGARYFRFHSHTHIDTNTTETVGSSSSVDIMCC